MSDIAPSDPTALPQGFAAVPLAPAERDASLRICLLACAAPAMGDERLVTIRTLPWAQVYLGCILDVGSRVHEWVEIWVQSVRGLADSPVSISENLTNAVLERRWQMQAELLREADPAAYIDCGLEAAARNGALHPTPSFLNGETLSLIALEDSDGGGPWQLCRDDAKLQAAGLPAFSHSLHRFLFHERPGQPAKFLALGGAQPEGTITPTLTEALAAQPGLTPFNPEAGLMMVRACYPLKLEEFVDMLGGRPPSQAADSGAAFRSPCLAVLPPVDNSPLEDGSGFLYWGAPGQTGRLAEVLHLKLHLLADILELVRASVKKMQAPFLNVAAESFQVRLGQPGARLPLFWTAKVGLARPSQAVEVPIRDADSRYFLRLGGSNETALFRQSLDQITSCVGLLTCTRVRSSQGKISLEGDLRPASAAKPLPSFSSSDLLHFGFWFKGEYLDFHGHATRKPTFGYSFDTIPKTIKPPELEQALLDAARVSLPPVKEFELIPGLGPADDLFDFGLLALRILLVQSASLQDQGNLAETFGLLQSLASQCKPGEQVQGIRAALEADLTAQNQAWVQLLGPQRLIIGDLAPKAAFDLVPPGLWAEVLAWVLGLLVAGDAQTGAADDSLNAPETIFNDAACALDKLLTQTRSLLFVDWSFNREISAVIGQIRKDL